MGSSHTRKRPIDQNIALRIQLARRPAGLTQAELADRAGETGTAISRWANGRHVPRDFIRPLSAALGVSFGWLHGEQVVTDEDRKLETILLRLALEGGDELIRELGEFENAEELLRYLQKRDRSKKP